MAGIGRLADKRASDVLARIVLGAARGAVDGTREAIAKRL